MPPDQADAAHPHEMKECPEKHQAYCPGFGKQPSRRLHRSDFVTSIQNFVNRAYPGYSYSRQAHSIFPQQTAHKAPCHTSVTKTLQLAGDLH